MGAEVMRVFLIPLGTRRFGRVDDVPGVCHVATVFFHVLYVPLVPLRSWVVFGGTAKDDSWQGIPIPMSFKSVLLAWLRLPILVAAGIFFLFAFGATGKDLAVAAGLAAIGALFVGLYFGTRRLMGASPSRARELEQAVRAARGEAVASRGLGVG
jgi:hypothetical protein